MPRGFEDTEGFGWIGFVHVFSSKRSVVQQQLQDHTGGDGHQDVVAATLYPVVTPRWCAEAVAAPVFYNVLPCAVLVRQVTAAVVRVVGAGTAFTAVAVVTVVPGVAVVTTRVVAASVIVVVAAVVLACVVAAVPVAVVVVVALVLFIAVAVGTGRIALGKRKLSGEE